jgi:hypothetical protein
VSDVLHRILTNASNQGYIKGIIINRFNIYIINLHFAVDTLLFLDASELVIHALRWILIGFENLSGVKINFSKCKMIPLNLSEEEGSQLASIFGYKIALVSWNIVCKSKFQGGLGVLDLNIINKSPLIKWLVRLRYPSSQGLWK